MPEDLQNSGAESAEAAEEQFISQFESQPETGEQATGGDEKAQVDEPLYELNYKGKKESYPVTKLIEFAQQGRDYAEKMGLFKKDRSTFEQERQGWKSEYEKQRQALDEYSAWRKQAESNPGWLDHVRQSYQQRLEAQATANPSDPMVQKLASTVEELTGKFSAIEQEKAQATAQKEDLALDQEITDYRAKFPDLPWGDVDEHGHDLEKRVLDHALKNGIRTFRAAANDLLFDEHINRAKTGGKEEVGKSIQKATKLGLGPPTKQPTMQPKKVQDVGKKSWAEVHQEAMAAMGE